MTFGGRFAQKAPRRTSAQIKLDKMLAAGGEDAYVIRRIRPVDTSKPRYVSGNYARHDEAVGMCCNVCGKEILPGEEAIVNSYSDGSRKFVHSGCPLKSLMPELRGGSS